MLRALVHMASFALVAGLLVSAIGCNKPYRDGPAFRVQSEPGPTQSLVYVYRVDSLRGVGAMDVKLDGEDLGRLGNQQYMALVVDPGEQLLSLRLRRFGFLPAAWSRVPFKAAAGKTYFVRAWAGYQAIDAGDAGRAMETPGRESARADVVVFAGLWSARDALTELAGTYRVGILDTQR